MQSSLQVKDETIRSLQAEKETLLREVDVLVECLHQHQYHSFQKLEGEFQRDTRQLEAVLRQKESEITEASNIHKRYLAMQQQNAERVSQQHAVELRLLQDQHALQLKVIESKASAAAQKIAQLEKEKQEITREKDAFIMQLQAEHARQIQHLLRSQLPSRA